MLPAYVKPCVKRGKTDAVDAEAICEAVTPSTMRFVPVKSADSPAALLDHKARGYLVRQRMQIVSAIRAHLGEFWDVMAQGIHDVDRLLKEARDVSPSAVPELDVLAAQLSDTQTRAEEVTARIGEMQGKDELARRLATLPGVGAISSSVSVIFGL